MVAFQKSLPTVSCPSIPLGPPQSIGCSFAKSLSARAQNSVRRSAGGPTHPQPQGMLLASPGERKGVPCDRRTLAIEATCGQAVGCERWAQEMMVKPQDG